MNLMIWYLWFISNLNRMVYYTSYRHKFCPYFKHLFRRKHKIYRLKISKKLKKYFEKGISMVVTQNDCLLLAYMSANRWASHRSIRNESQGNFSYHLRSCNLQSFEILVPPGAGTFLQHQPQFIVQWIYVWTGEKAVIRFLKSGTCSGNYFCIFFAFWAGAESCWKHHSSLSANTVSSWDGKTSFTVAL